MRHRLEDAAPATQSPHIAATPAGMIHLSVAIGRFVEALFYAILRVAGLVTGVVLLIAFAGAVLFLAAGWMLKRRR